MILTRKSPPRPFPHTVVRDRGYPRPEMRSGSKLRGLPLAGIAAAGVVLGHWLTYVFAVPDPQIRTEILAASGHSYWLLAVKAAVVLGFVSLGTVFVRHLGAATRGETTVADRVIALAARLSFVQLAAFTAMEVVERIAAGAPVAGMLGHHLFVLGLSVQIVVAFAGAFVLLWFGRAAARICQAITECSPSRPAVLPAWPSLSLARPVPVLSGAGGVRGPPHR